MNKIFKIIWEYPVFEKHPMLMAFTFFIWYPIGIVIFIIYKIGEEFGILRSLNEE